MAFDWHGHRHCFRCLRCSPCDVATQKWTERRARQQQWVACSSRRCFLSPSQPNLSHDDVTQGKRNGWSSAQMPPRCTTHSRWTLPQGVQATALPTGSRENEGPHCRWFRSSQNRPKVCRPCPLNRDHSATSSLSCPALCAPSSCPRELTSRPRPPACTPVPHPRDSQSCACAGQTS